MKVRRGLLYWFFLSCLFLICVQAVYKRSPGLLDRCSSYLVYPFLTLHHAYVDPINRWLTGRHTIKELHIALINTQRERDDLMAESIMLRSELAYVSDIKDMVQVDTQLTHSSICVAQIIAKNLSDTGHYFLIDRGANHGITTDMIGVHKQCLVGKIVEVWPWYSKLLVLTDKNCKVACSCFQTKTTGIHEGCNNKQSTTVRFVSHLKPIIIGDYLISTGEGLLIPRGLGVGRVISCTPSGLYYVIDIKPLIDVDSIKYCTIIKRGEVSTVNGASKDNIGSDQ